MSRKGFLDFQHPSAILKDSLRTILREIFKIVPTCAGRKLEKVIKLRRDCMAIAETGMGKTAVFLIPIISHYLEKFTYYPNMISNSKSQQIMSPAAPKVVIVAPTRELAVQIATNARSLAVDTCLLDQIALVYGGASMDDQAESLSRGCVILVATIGRLLDFINRDMVKIDDVEFLVIDESDRQLMDGFEER